MATDTLIIVVGGDYLAYEVCREILKTAGARVALVWKHDDERAARLLSAEAQSLHARFGDAFTFFNIDAAEGRSLRAAGLREPSVAGGIAYCLVAVSQDDRLNLRVALQARDINENVRVTIRQFNPLLGRKIQEGLQYNCTAISPAAHAAATYAAAAVDPSCFYALQFPTLEEANSTEGPGVLFGFTERPANAALGVRIVAENGDRVVAFGPLEKLKRAPRGRGAIEQSNVLFERYTTFVRDAFVGLRRIEPLLRGVFLSGFVLFVLFVIFFAKALHLNLVAAAYFVITTMSTVGYGDITPCKDCATQSPTPSEVLAMLVAIVVMVVGISLFAVFTATITSSLNAATNRRLQGLRPIHRRGHVIVCGAGNVGSLVIKYLRDLGEKVVVVEKNPDALLVEMARDRKIDLLTGDAANDETIGYCSPERAKALIGVTNSDTANLEVALGARTRTRERGQGELHVVLRIDDLKFGASIKRHFGIASFSTTELATPTIAGLARFESTRGRITTFAGTPHARTYQIAEHVVGASDTPLPDTDWIPLYAWREGPQGKGEAVPVDTFQGDAKPGDRLLYLVPLTRRVHP